jgi:inosine-uridine nucleoside N-ribohydrolase
MLIHLDTDFGGDPDDACALAFLLASPLADLIAITTNLDHEGFRAGCVRYYLNLAGRSDIPVAAGAATTLTDNKRFDSTAKDPRYWPDPIRPAPASVDTCLDLLQHSIERGAVIVAIGAATNLALLQLHRPGILSGVRVVFMGGYVHPPAPGLPQWGPEADWNVQCDPRSASILAEHADVTLVTLPATLNTWLRAAHLDRLRAAGRVGALLAQQSELYATDRNLGSLAAKNAALPRDLINFHYDPVTAAVAVGWDGARIERLRLRPALLGGVLRFEENDHGRLMNIVVNVEGDAFADYWLQTVEQLAPAT